MRGLIGKVVITGALVTQSGLHIGAGNEFSAIGAVDNQVIRDIITKQPYIPGSSIKGKLRFLLARKSTKTGILPEPNNDVLIVQRLFGNAPKDGDILLSRLQFSDVYMSKESVSMLKNISSDLYLTESKWENTISRSTGKAKPRQSERVPRNVQFDFKLVYNIESLEEMEEDLMMVKEGLQLLEQDYLGGSGSRGYGRVSFEALSWEGMLLDTIDQQTITQLLKTL